MQPTKTLTVIAVLSVPFFLFGEEKVWKSTFIERPAAIGSGIVRATVGMGLEKKMLLAPVILGQPWAVVDAAGGRVALPLQVPNVPVALSHAYVAWGEHTPLGAKIHRIRLRDLREEVVSSDSPGPIEMVIAGEVIYILQKNPFGWGLGRVKAGRFERIASLDESSSFLVLGECSEESVVVIDPRGVRLNLLSSPDFRNSGFVEMRSDLVEAAKRRNAALRNMGSARSFSVFAHRKTEDGHGLVIAHGVKGVGQYYVEFDAKGEELRRSLLRYPQGDSRKSGAFYFRRFNGTEQTLEATGSGGETAIYDRRLALGDQH